MKKSLAIFGLVAVLGFVNANQVMAQSVKIGFLATMSGPSGALGQDQYDGFMLGIEHAGGKLGGASVEVIKEDDQQKPDVAIPLVQKLLEKDKVNIMTGITFSNVMMAVHKPITSAGVILIGSNAGPTPITGKGCSPLYFSTSWNNETTSEALGSYANQLGYKKAYIMAPNYQAGKDMLNGFKRNYKGQLVDEIYTPINQPDYSAEIAQLQAANPDMVYIFYPGGMGVNFIKQYQQAGLLGKLPLLSVNTVDGTTLPALKDLAVGVVTASNYSPDLDNPQNKKFVADFQAKFGRVPSAYAAQSYDAAQLLNAALAKTGGKADNAEVLRVALKTANFSSVSGPFKFNNNQFPIRNYYRVDVAKDSSGQAVFVTKAIAMKEQPDSYASECELK